MTPTPDSPLLKLAEPNYSAERLLPDGKTCADCRHGAICDGLFGAVRKGFTSCDFWPSRFHDCPATALRARASTENDNG